MRPSILNPLFADLTTLEGVGPKTAALLQKVAGPRLIDLVFTLPSGVIDRSHRPPIEATRDGEHATLTLTVDAHEPPPANRPRSPYRILCSDGTGCIRLVFFRAHRDWLEKQLPQGATRIVSGKVEQYGNQRQMVHPDAIVDPDKDGELPSAEPVYPLTAGLQPKIMLRAVRDSVAQVPDLPEWHRPDVIAREAFPSFQTAIREAHNPETRMDLLPDTPHRRRLAYDEFFASQLALALTRRRQRSLGGRSFRGDGSLVAAAKAALPFDLTGDQQKALQEIQEDLARPQKMVRLLQGDVGSGKTAVGVLAALSVIEAGAQATLMAPTEILARQHFESIEPMLKAAGVSSVLLTGRDKGQERAAKRRALAEGFVQLAVGTHAVFSEDVEFEDLGLAIIDEQHRFGVQQRLKLQEKGQGTDVLVMTATPIPRTLALTAYGDMDVSQIREKPPGRKPVDTRAIPLARLNDVVAGVRRAMDAGGQVYWVCPLVEANDQLEATAAEERFAHLQTLFGDQVELVHGKMKGPEKDAAVARFASGACKLLVATTVIEVGVNAPDATVIVIEHAERFGLAQLHQLRGRVGRGEKPGSCILLYGGEPGGLSETTKARLNVLRNSQDGFEIAEEDLRLRGSGDALGTAQSGFPTFTLASLGDHQGLLEMAAADAKMVVEEDPELQSERGEALRVLLYLFSRDDAVRRLRAG
ncbi:ATP-dependent DNA helicase RecG [Parvularcula lutaonensis]|uniref:Probable DNA 3'-5' helicase RecG n=1 Tax=Parvularcula lutaonensis TaxID=491923 RepID=A0ABV7M9H7_9PROT|nr:ATP-dependent DNA helicase RecG [Parvularcula lutaonensis]GGY42426.1 ATP-dependent DNA helicase RecG [Parvularcula lutaonensis]